MRSREKILVLYDCIWEAQLPHKLFKVIQLIRNLFHFLSLQGHYSVSLAGPHFIDLEWKSHPSAWTNPLRDTQPWKRQMSLCVFHLEEALEAAWLGRWGPWHNSLEWVKSSFLNYLPSPFLLLQTTSLLNSFLTKKFLNISLLMLPLNYRQRHILWWLYDDSESNSHLRQDSWEPLRLYGSHSPGGRNPLRRQMCWPSPQATLDYSLLSLGRLFTLSNENPRNLKACSGALTLDFRSCLSVVLRMPTTSSSIFVPADLNVFMLNTAWLQGGLLALGSL